MNPGHWFFLGPTSDHQPPSWLLPVGAPQTLGLGLDKYGHPTNITQGRSSQHL